MYTNLTNIKIEVNDMAEREGFIGGFRNLKSGLHRGKTEVDFISNDRRARRFVDNPLEFPEIWKGFSGRVKNQKVLVKEYKSSDGKFYIKILKKL